ncbi:MAG: TAT-variant-translocated molybdopterin oxidoreductase [Terriglobia bacterium]|nr:TAT-variant-translocated molybdopterin oxidoreductase [Terriglobia bacterium]
MNESESQRMDNEKTRKEDVCPGKRSKLELTEVREELSKATGPRYWRTLDELAQTPEFEEMLHREFPRQASEWIGDGTSRRGFMKIMGASLALAGMSACTKQPLEPIVPYDRQPEQVTLGIPLFFATAMPFPTGAMPLLVESHEGRPTKVEGNPQHPWTLGGTDIYSQASPLTMYDPDRSQNPTYLGDATTWGNFVTSMRTKMQGLKANGGAGLRILTGSINSPSLIAQIRDLQKMFPQMKWYQWEAINRDNVFAASAANFGQPLEPQYLIEKARVLLSLDCDFLSNGYPSFLHYARMFASRRNPDLKQEMLRFYAVEGTPTNTGGKADHRLPVKTSEVETFARALAAQLGVAGAGGQVSGEAQQFVQAVAKDLQAHRGASLVVVGDRQPPAVHMLANAINQTLGNVGQTIVYTEPVETNPVSKMDQIRELIGEMNAGKVEMLIVSNVNPVYDTPAELGFTAAYMKVPLRIQHGMFYDETANLSHWHLDGTHYLEQWGDARSSDGTISIVQPLIAPLYGGKSQHELFGFLLGNPDTVSYDVVRSYWQGQHTGTDFEAWWRKVLHDGFVANTAFAPRNVAARGAALPPAQPASQGIELLFHPDPTVYDGRFANNGWLQECPKPMFQITWGNPVLVSAATAKQLNLKSEDVVEIEYQGRKQKGAIWIQPGHPDNAATVFIGYGRTLAGHTGSGLGFNAYMLQSQDSPWIGRGAKLTKTGETFGLAYTQGFQNMDGRAIVRAATLEDFIKNPGFPHEMVEAPEQGLTLYKPYNYSEVKWGMTIDLNACIGCKACVVACQSENNIPVVGKLEVKRGRYMHWLRIDNYHEGTPENPKTYFQPVPCMQCETAPCEVVCPVGATVHSSEGLNDMVYNRCVGTRYCSNNCPYKVRRFNFMLYQDWDTVQLKFVRNPEVTVRSRGVMEKCTYCVQRITRARIHAEETGRGPRPKDGEVLTACQQACPAGAIVFGDMNDPTSKVMQLKVHQRNYGLLEDLNTRPRTTYLAAVTNPNPELEA